MLRKDFLAGLTLSDHEGGKKPEKESVQGSSSSSNDKQPLKSPSQQPLKEEKEEEVVKGSSKAVSCREWYNMRAYL